MSDGRLSKEEFDAILRADFFSFFLRVFGELEPSTALASAAYLRLLCLHLQSVAAGAITRLIVNMPPRHLKTSVTSVIWVAWMLAKDPNKKIAIICHNETLVIDIASKCKRLIETSWYRQFAPHVRISTDRDRTKDYVTSAGGNVFVTTIETGITGRGFDAIILDDPQSAPDARSPTERDRVFNLFEEAISTRLNDQVHGQIVVVQQRLHDDDLTGKLIARGGWTHLSLPLIAPEDATYEIGDFRWTRKAGEVLCPEWLSVEGAQTLRSGKSPGVFETQYQQSPSTAIGEIIKPEHLLKVAVRPPSANRWFVSVDTATKALSTSSFTVFLIVAFDGTNHYISNVIRRQCDVTEMRDIASRLYDTYRIENFLIEDSAAGPGLQSLMSKIGLRSELVGTKGKDKITRLEKRLHFFSDQKIYIVGDAPWTEVFSNELLRFPVARYDDQVDALTLYLQYMSERPNPRPILVPGGGVSSFTPPLGPKLRKGEHPMRPRPRRR